MRYHDGGQKIEFKWIGCVCNEIENILGDPVEFGNRLYDRAMQLFVGTVLLQLSGALFAPYLRYDWTYVDPNT